MNDSDLNLASNFFGPLDGEIRARLLAVVDNPTTETWDEAYSIILNPDVGLGLTLWQAVLEVDPTFHAVPAPVSRWVEDDSELGGHSEPVSGWGRAPSRDAIVQAINYATH